MNQFILYLLYAISSWKKNILILTAKLNGVLLKYVDYPNLFSTFCHYILIQYAIVLMRENLSIHKNTAQAIKFILSYCIQSLKRIKMKRFVLLLLLLFFIFLIILFTSFPVRQMFAELYVEEENSIRRAKVLSLKKKLEEPPPSYSCEDCENWAYLYWV